MQKVNKHTVLKTARDKGYWSGYIVGNKVNSDQTLEQFINAFLYYLPRELGTRVAYWDGNKLGMAVYSDGE